MREAIYYFEMLKIPKMRNTPHQGEFWSIRAEWHHGVETPEETIRRVQQFVAAITEIAPIFSEFVVAPRNKRFSDYKPGRLVDALKKNPMQEAYFRGDDAVSYPLQLLVLPVKGVQSYIYLHATVCRGSFNNELQLHLGDVGRKMFKKLTVNDWVAILEQLAVIFEPKFASFTTEKFWHARLERIGWANYVSRATSALLPTDGFPAVIPVRDLGAIYLCSREFTGATTDAMLATGTKFKAALDAIDGSFLWPFNKRL